jgi:hypothetical protein
LFSGNCRFLAVAEIRSFFRITRNQLSQDRTEKFPRLFPEKIRYMEELPGSYPKFSYGDFAKKYDMRKESRCRECVCIPQHYSEMRISRTEKFRQLH